MTTSPRIEALLDNLNTTSIPTAASDVSDAAITPFPFMRLPLDIRHMVYEHLLTFRVAQSPQPDFTSKATSDTTFSKVTASVSKATVMWRSELPNGCHPQVLATCQAINEEAGDLLFSHNMMSVLVTHYGLVFAPLKSSTHFGHYGNGWNRTDSITCLTHRFIKFKVVVTQLPAAKNLITSIRILDLAIYAKWLCERLLVQCPRIAKLDVHFDIEQPISYRYPYCYGQTQDQEQSIPEMLQYTPEQWLLKSFRSLRQVEKLVITGGEVSEEDIQDLRKVVAQPKTSQAQGSGNWVALKMASHHIVAVP